MSAEIVYLNGKLLPLQEAMIPVTDRGFLFGDGVYESVQAYQGQAYQLDLHLARLQLSLEMIRLDAHVDLSGFPKWCNALLTANPNPGHQAQNIYLQITRGSSALREHHLPNQPSPTIFARCSVNTLPNLEAHRDGYRAITLPDQRSKMASIKSINLLPNILARQIACEQGAVDAILLDEQDRCIEASSANLFIAKNNILYTPPEQTGMISGVTRATVIRLARALGLTVIETDLPLKTVLNADEVLISSATRLIYPLVKIDDAVIAAGQTGPLWQQLYSAFIEDVKQHCQLKSLAI